MLATFNPGLLILVCFAVMAVVIIWAVRVQARKTREALVAFAARTGLRLTEKTVLGFTVIESLEGEQQGRLVRYWTFATGSGKSRTNWVAVGVRVRGDTALEFDLTRQGFGSKLMEWFGVKEIQVGDPAFDRAWFVRTNQPEFLAAALVQQIRARLMAEAAGRGGSHFKLEQGLVRYIEPGTLAGAAVLERLEARLPLLQDLADMAEVFSPQA